MFSTMGIKSTISLATATKDKSFTSPQGCLQEVAVSVDHLIFRKDYLPASSVSLQVVFTDRIFWEWQPKSKKGDISQKVYPLPTAHPTHKPS